jgi:hypothetical protein
MNARRVALQRALARHPVHLSEGSHTSDFSEIIDLVPESDVFFEISEISFSPLARVAVKSKDFA